LVLLSSALYNPPSRVVPTASMASCIPLVYPRTSASVHVVGTPPPLLLCSHHLAPKGERAVQIPTALHCLHYFRCCCSRLAGTHLLLLPPHTHLRTSTRTLAHPPTLLPHLSHPLTHPLSPTTRKRD
jgi:hypothetical protein